METLTIPLRPVLLFLVVLARVGGLVTFAPFWSHRAVPARARVLIALALALIVTPIAAPGLATPPAHIIGLAVVVAGELLVGFALGFVGRVIFAGLELAAHILGAQMGLTLAATIDPATRAQTGALGTLAQMFGLMILLASDGHHRLLAATVDSFRLVAPGTAEVTPALAELFVRLSADALAAGVALAAPAIVALLAVEVGLAVAGRAAPQLQVMLLGFPVKIVAGLWLTGAALFMLPDGVRRMLSATAPALRRVLAAL